jgi:hypothetical protein
MTYLDKKITTFFKKRNEIFIKPLERIIDSMLEKCRYINGESLERHNWRDKPIKLKYIPKNINSRTFEEELLKALDLNEDERSTVELLWGDIQLGKRIQACIIMWISVHILERPVLYIFRNLSIDQKQLQDDILGTEEYNFNIAFIKNAMNEYNKELQQYFEETNDDYWKDYKLPELKDINADDIINKLSNKDALNPKDIFCCLMNQSQLDKINKKFSEYISYNDELVNITVLVDEADLMAPTSSNDRTNVNDKKDTTACEVSLAKIYKKVKYALQITGTAHSLLYNVTTRLTDNTDIQVKISKVHKMKRDENYYGLFNNNITFNTSLVKSWWEYENTELSQKTSYNIIEDYNINIKNIIKTILERKTIKYNSLLLSEEKLRAGHFSLTDKIIKDFSDLFIIIYHGNCLRLYLSKKYVDEIKYWAQWDSEKSLTSKRLWQNGGIFGIPKDTEKSEKLANNYCYFDIDTEILNIKLVYKLLRILFKKSKIPITHKTIITITGKYGERGYSFTSDDYNEYILHLTDQYFISHASFNCTDISQRIRLQGKYNDKELKDKTMNLTLWTTSKLENIMKNFYIKFINEIEKKIMKCNDWEDIKKLIEHTIDTGDMNYPEYMKYIDVRKKRKNIDAKKCLDKKNESYKLINISNMNQNQIAKWCEDYKERKLPSYICVNEIKETNISDFIKTYGINKVDVKYFENLNSEECINFLSSNNIDKPSNEWHQHRETNKENNIYKDRKRKEWKPMIKDDIEEIAITHIDGSRRWYYCYEDNTFKKLFYAITYLVKGEKILPRQTNDYIKDIPYSVDGNKVKYSILKEEYKSKENHGYVNEDEDDIIEDSSRLPDEYYTISLDGWLYLHRKSKEGILARVSILSPSNTRKTIEDLAPSETLINPDVSSFANSCCKKTDKKNLRFGLSDIYKIYKEWCKKNGKYPLKIQKFFKDEFEKLNYKEEESKGVDINNKPGKRGYNIMVSLNLE